MLGNEAEYSAGDGKVCEVQLSDGLGNQLSAPFLQPGEAQEMTSGRGLAGCLRNRLHIRRCDYLNSNVATGLFNVDSLFRWLGERFPIEVIPSSEYKQADFLLCDTRNDNHESYRGVKILLTGENHSHDLNRFDYCLTHDLVGNDRCHRFPYWVYGVLMNPERARRLLAVREPLTVDDLKSQNRRFCAFVSYNAAAKKRVRVVKKLMSRRMVSCGGLLMNNVGGPVKDKIGFLKEHLFSIAYENEAYPGYQTEKIVDAFIARSIPLYWGNSAVEQEFNPKAFIHERNFRSEDEMVDYVVNLADDQERLVAMLNEPILQDADVLKKAEAELEAFFRRIFDAVLAQFSAHAGKE